ncbi:signal peptidase II [Crossiella equi]|uniref:Lipoprotein signal peptidase n=1 Tax=Crossiella equi TaxID=130796 RepID=A0ABS5ALH1_9PSEU|nr:signal peptidase II [Crossiella equi]MBP2477420.1 signal peptidase II [Crossiella equi]
MSTESAPAAAPAHPRRLAVTLVVAAILLVVDQLSKWWAESELTGAAPIPVIGEFIRFRLLYNPGAAFSLGADATWVFAILSGVAVIALVWVSLRVRHTGWALALGLLLGGAATHLGDRLFREPGFARGHVVDFIDYNGWFVGNIADIALFLGAVTLLLLSFLGIGLDGTRESDKEAEEAPSE